MNIKEIWRKFHRYMCERKCYRGGHTWYVPEDGPLPKDCPKCVAEIIAKYGKH